MLRSKEAFYSIKWDFTDWENIFQRKTHHRLLASLLGELKDFSFSKKFSKKMIKYLNTNTLGWEI